ncbi:MAG TPA: phosphomannose isomerase type II C-terminal cupin domain [Candidatus Paceibacterota bacterium]|nr:phosphomannose isomerase type II C-terminal cupin domain [Candidatus Paceibacterota bacterium]
MDGLHNYEHEQRPWGNFERFTLNEKTTVKIITVGPGEAFSLQTHARRDEFWRVLAGSGTIRIGDDDHPAKAGDTFWSPRGTIHRTTGGPEGITFLEIAFGEFDEADITRLEDRYGRTPS